MARVVITVVAPGARADLSVPEETTVEALLPVVMDVCAADRSAAWTLTPKGGRPLVPRWTLAEGGVLHGSILLLQPRVPPVAARAAPPAVELRVVSGPDAGRRVALEPGSHRVGGDRSSRIVLDDRALAPVHVLVQVDAAGGVTVAPAGPCLLDGSPLSGPERLRPGQVLVAGRSLLAFGRLGEAALGPWPAADADAAAADAPRIEAPAVPEPPAAWLHRGHREARARFRARLAELDRSLSAVRGTRLAELTARAPDAATLLALLERGERPDPRRPGHPDWLRLRLGWADQPSGLGAVVGPRGSPALRTEAMRVAVRHGTLRAAPVALSLPEQGPLGITGDPEAGLALARWLRMQVMALHDAADVAVLDRMVRLNADEEVLRSCGAVLELPPGGARPRLAIRGAEPCVLGGFDGLSVELAERAAAALLAMPAASGEPVRRELAELLVPGDRPEQHVVECWIRDRASPPPRELRAVLGADAGGRPVELDLRRNGPHVLVSGGSAAARRELLQAIVTSLAIRHAPRSFDLLLAGTFPAVAGLPHVVERAVAGAAALVVAVEGLPSGELLAAGGPDAHVLVATAEPDRARSALRRGVGVEVTLSAAGDRALVRDGAGLTAELWPAGAASVPRLVAAIATAGELLG
jgi:hypothetical protein